MYKRNKNLFVMAFIAVISMGITSGSAFAGGFLDVEFGDGPFGDPLIINNPYWPLRPDNSYTPRTFTYIGETEDECVIDQISVDDLTYGSSYALTGAAPYGGKTAVQVVDTEWVFEDLPDGVECGPDLLLEVDANQAIKEFTLDWYLQDNQQNI